MTARPSETTATNIELRTMCERLAREAGLLALAGRRATAANAMLGAVTKSSPTDLVTRFDQAAERLIVDTLRLERPDDAIIGEEGAADDGTSGYEWFIDPIDGTTNFVFDQPVWACSVGVKHRGQTVAGAVYLPPLDEMFTAALRGGATLNEAPITPTGQHDLALSLVGTGFAYRADLRLAQAHTMVEILPAVRDIRRLGSAAADLCYVACGRLDVYFERGVNSWDVAAGELIAREAGACTSDFSGGAYRPEESLAAAPGVHLAFVDLLSRATSAD